MISALPLPVGGAGGVEAAIAFALHGIGVPLAPALLSAFVYRIITFWLPVIPALMLLPSMRRLNDTLPATSRTRPDADEPFALRPSDEAGRRSAHAVAASR